MIHDYKKYKLSPAQNIKYLLQGFSAVSILGILFYKSIIGILLLSPLVYFYIEFKKRKLANDRKWQLNLEFKDGIIALSAALEAGYSAENAFDEACRDLSRIYPDSSLILREFNYILNQLRMNFTVEMALSDFGERAGIEDILSFSEVFRTAKRTGGDLINVIKITGDIITDKIEVKREILTLITAKRLEANIMKLTPLFILFYLSVSSPGFLAPLYHNAFGIIIMTLFLACYLGALFMIDKIIAIEV